MAVFYNWKSNKCNAQTAVSWDQFNFPSWDHPPLNTNYQQSSLKCKFRALLLYYVSGIHAIVVKKTCLRLNRGRVRGCWLIKSSLALGLGGGSGALHVTLMFNSLNLNRITVYLVLLRLLLQKIVVFLWYLSLLARRQFGANLCSIKNICGFISTLTSLNLVMSHQLTLLKIVATKQTSRLSCQARSIFWNSRVIRTWWLRELESSIC